MDNIPQEPPVTDDEALGGVRPSPKVAAESQPLPAVAPDATPDGVDSEEQLGGVRPSSPTGVRPSSPTG